MEISDNVKLQIVNFFSVLILSLVLSGCSQPKNASSEYSRSQINTAQETIVAKILSKRLVNIEGESGIGKTAGGLTGYIAGSTLGKSETENAIGAIAGAIFGATAGSAVESKLQSVEATEYILKKETGGMVTIIMTSGNFRVGEKVYVSMSGQAKILGVVE